MPAADLFTRLGFLLVDGFVDAGLLAALRSELEGAAARRAEFYQVATGWKVNEDIRRAKWLEPSAETRARLDERLQGLKPRVEEHFQLKLATFEEPQYLRYEAGDYIRLHMDTDAAAEGELSQRKVSVIMFFNDQIETGGPGTYAGGSLAFGLPLRGAGGMVRVPLPVRAGLLVGFPARIPHEVQPVSRGVRYSAVTWFR